jgi:hypothetical protein
MESEGSLPYSQQPATGPYPEPHESNPAHCIHEDDHCTPYGVKYLNRPTQKWSQFALLYLHI